MKLHRSHRSNSTMTRTGSGGGRTLLGLLLTCALWLGLAPTPAAAAVDRPALTDLLFAAQVQMLDRGLDRVGHLVLSAELLEWRRGNPSASPQQVTDHFAARKQALEAGLSAQDLELAEPDYALRAVTVLMAAAPSSTAAAPHVRALLGVVVGSTLGEFDSRQDLANGALHTAQWLRGKGEVENAVWAAVRRKARADTGFAQAWNHVLGTPLGIDATTTFERIRHDEKLVAYVDIDKIIVHEGSPADFLEAARLQFAAASEQLAAQTDQAREQVKEQTAACPSKTGTACSQENKTEAEKAAKERQKKIDELAAAAKALAGIVGTYDKQAGEMLGKTAAGLAAIATAINTYISAIAGRGAVDAIFSLATVSMTGNVIAAAMTLVSLFWGSSGGPSAEQRLLEEVLRQLEGIRTQITALHTEMRDSFERIDAQLNLIYTAMMTEFAKLRIEIAGNTAALVNIQNQLASIDLKLDRVLVTLMNAFMDEQLHPARDNVNMYVGYRENYSGPIPTYGEYKIPENTFHFAATDVSWRTAFIVGANTAGDPTSVLNSRGDELEALSYLSRYANSHYGLPYLGNNIPNPAVWNYAAQAYMALQIQNPAYAARIGAHRSPEIQAQGQRILAAARSFSQPLAAPDATGSRTNEVFTNLLAAYRGAVGSFATELGELRTQQIVVRDEGLATMEPKTYDLFGSANQPVPSDKRPADPTQVPRCGGSTPITRPSNARYELLPGALRFANYAYQEYLEETDVRPGLDHCYEVSWTNVRKVNWGDGEDTYGRLRLTFKTRFRWASEAWRTARSVSHTWPEQAIGRRCFNKDCHGGYPPVTVDQALTAKWPRDREIFEQNESAYSDNALSSEVSLRMREFLAGRQHALYVKAIEGVRNANTDLNIAVTGMNTAARLLQAYTRLGFPIALTTDDLLSGLLFGRYQIPVNWGGDAQIETALGVARDAYTCRAPADTLGTPCIGAGSVTYNPLVNQPRLETYAYLDGWGKIMCDTSGVAAADLPGDPVGDCLTARTVKRIDALTARYRHHSQQLADGTYVEELPWVRTTLNALPVVDAVVRAQPTP